MLFLTESDLFKWSLSDYSFNSNLVNLLFPDSTKPSITLRLIESTNSSWRTNHTRRSHKFTQCVLDHFLRYHFIYLFIALVYEDFTYCVICIVICQQTRVMALSEKAEFILCEIKSSLFHDSSHRNGNITAFRSICDAYNLFGIKVKVTITQSPSLSPITHDSTSSSSPSSR